jgi:uncharacterized protein
LQSGHNRDTITRHYYGGGRNGESSVRTANELPERELVAVATGLVRENDMDPWGLHGLSHWWRVRHNGLLIAEAMGATPRVVKLFAIFHDAHRWDDGSDAYHGPRAAAWLARVRQDSDPLTSVCSCATTRDVIRSLAETEFRALHEACELHTKAMSHDDATVSACLVADRLDLSRVGNRPDPNRMPAPAILLHREFIDAAVARERAGLTWQGGAEIATVWGV